MASRKIEDLIPEMQEKAMVFAVKMAEAGIPFMFTCTLRTQAEQDALYAQGRTAPGRIITWTTRSKHIEGKAFDIAILSKGKPTWDTKISVNKKAVPSYEEAGLIGESIGLAWGGRFKDGKDRPRPDMPHFQLAEAPF